MRQDLPVASRATVARRVHELGTRHRRTLLGCAVLQMLATVAALAPPRLLAHLVGTLDTGLTQADADRTAGLLLHAVLVGSGLTRWSRLWSAVLGEELLAELREDFVEGVLSLPLGTVERAGTGDLLTRTTSDVDALSKTVRLAVPEVLVALITVVLVVAAMVLVAPLASATALVAIPVVVVGTGWYLRRAPEGYLAERAAASLFNSRVAESVEAGRTVETLGLQQQRVALLRRTSPAPGDASATPSGCVACFHDLRVLLRRPGGGHPDHQRPAGAGRPRHPCAGHRRHALRPATGRPRRHPAGVAGQAAGRYQLPGPAARRTRCSGRPHNQQRGPRLRAALRGRRLLLLRDR